MTKKEVLDIILSERVLAIIRMQSGKTVVTAIAAVVEGGINALEITSNTPDFLQHIEKARNTHPHTLTGAGTILNGKLASAAINAGAQFLVTPGTNVEIIRVASDAGIPVIMGAYTTTEILQASQAGADIIKLFPAGIAGIPYMKSVMAPLDEIKIFAVGGINAENAKDWLKAGAAGIGIGSQLLVRAADGELDLSGTVENVKRLKDMIQKIGF
jgi:2-dehydro-3-deoxyphosphogluconate aldolase/(4S)-4-hydroxy-2-oxoglutarate aldolase